MGNSRAPDFFSVPPFPGAKLISLVGAPAPTRKLAASETADLIARIARDRVGGAYWGARPKIPNEAYTLVKTGGDGWSTDYAVSVPGDRPAVIWQSKPADSPLPAGAHTIEGLCDPWHLISGAKEVVVQADDDLALIAAIAQVPVRCVGEGRYSLLGKPDNQDQLRHLFEELFVAGRSYVDPFTQQPASLDRIIQLSAFWKELIDSNREIGAAVGFAFWKRPTVAPLLWNGDEVRFAKPLSQAGAVAIWKSRASGDELADLQAAGTPLLEVEDGFIRSAGLGADCVPPLSIIVDRSGIYFDPAKASDLEHLLERGTFSSELIQRAMELRETIVATGISKYEKATGRLDRRAPGPHLLVPGQVEDDRSVQCGGGEVKTNLELLRRARQAAPDAYIIYKPHPDVEAGHRVGAIPDSEALRLADEIVRDAPISALIDLCDEVHVNTSLAGFEALLRGKRVTTHGVPFYAGWGLTRDLGRVPERRTASRTLDELVAAALLLYPRYLDPVTGLPCPPEILVKHLTVGNAPVRSRPLVALRQLQGRLRRALATALRR